MKKTEVYIGKYDSDKEPKILDFLRNRYIHLSGDIDYPNENESFLFLEDNTLFKINYNIPIQRSERKVIIQIQKPFPISLDIKTPKELSDLLEGNGYKKSN